MSTQVWSRWTSFLCAASLVGVVGGCGGGAAQSADAQPDTTAVPDGAVPGQDGPLPADGGEDAADVDAAADDGGEAPDGSPDGAEVDEDRDGYSVAAGDCDDGDPSRNPGRPDVPDLEARDSNCDGRDGVVGRDVYVDPAWTTAELQAAIDDCAAAVGCHALFPVATYALTAPLALPAGARLYGGYAADFLGRDVAAVDTTDQSTALVGGVQRETIAISEQTGTVSLEGLRIVGPTSAAESYAVWIHESDDVRLRYSQVLGGKGADGASAGTSGAGGPGGAASGRTAGQGCYWNDGGDGGWGNTIFAWEGGCGHGGGQAAFPGYGADGWVVPRSFNPQTSFGCWIGSTWCDVTTKPAAPHAPNFNGLLNAQDHLQDGPQGTCGEVGTAAPVSLGALGSDGRWIAPSAGGSGQTGEEGAGGAGGWNGASWMGVYCFFSNCATYGADPVCEQQATSGGGGGGGGCGGAGGAGGGPGHASIAVLVSRSSVDFTHVVVATGTGGAGGTGGGGGDGGPGGAFGQAGTTRVNHLGCVYSDALFCPTPDWNKAGLGGWGGAGGSGGGGGGAAGGNGGAAIGVAVTESTVTADDLSVDTSVGASGGGGAAGASGKTPVNVYGRGYQQCGSGVAGNAGSKVAIHEFQPD